MTRYLSDIVLTAVMLLVGGGCITKTVEAATLGTLCEACTQTQRVESAESRGLAFPGSYGSGIVWVADFPNEVIEKYYVFKEDLTLSPQKTPDIETALLRDGIAPEDVVTVYEPSTRGTIVATAVRLQATTEEMRQAALVVDVVNNVLRPIGSGRLPNRHDPDAFLRSGNVPTVGTFQVPPGVAASAYDLIGDHSTALQVGQQMQQHHSILLNAVQTGSIIQAVFNLPVNTDFAARFQFPDGSFGNWEIDHSGRLAANFGTFEDSEGNQIPHRSSDPDGNVFNFGGGRESSNFQNMATRIQILGFSVNDSGGGGGSCRFSCNSDSCTVTCSAK